MASDLIAVSDYLEGLKPQILERWRAAVRSDPEQYALVHHLDDQELQDHLPALTGHIIHLLRGEPAQGFERDAAQHGSNRRALGFSIIPVLHELQIFRRILVAGVEESRKAGVNLKAIHQARQFIIEALDRSMNISISQYTLAAEEERKSAQGEARELQNQRDRFLVTLSHELRNQISPILLGVQLLKDQEPTDLLIQEAVERIERQARHQAILIDDLLDISRFRYGKLQLRRENLDLRAPVQHALETLQSAFSAKNLKLSAELPERPLNVSADRTRIAQVLINLLNNSLKFTPAGGSVSVRLFEQDAIAVLTVQDTGAGISPTALPQLFGMFYQAETTMPPVKGGLGIGLALARILVEMHDGSIEASSAGEGLGAEFTVRLPITGGGTVEQTSPSARILLADDNLDHLNLLAALLKRRGYEVFTAENGTAALRIAAEKRLYACVIDIGLPDMDGYELARQLRALPGIEDLRLIAVTGYSTLMDENTFAAAGFDHYFSKPLKFERLVQVLEDEERRKKT